MAKKRKIAVVTGTRAEFGIWRPVLEAMGRSKKIEAKLVVTGMHLQKGFGRTVEDVRASGVRIAAEAGMYRGGESAAESLARGTKNLARAFEEVGAEMVMVLGDRLELRAAASAALALQIPMGHVHGGETAPGQWDEQIRHAITKMAHVHFCATKRARERILRMGEEKGRVFVVGAPAIDTLNAYIKSLKGRGTVSGGVGSWSHGMVLLHPSSAKDAVEQKRALQLIAALRVAGIPFSVVGPNNDPGHGGILRAYEKAGVPIDMSMPQKSFWQHVCGSSFLIGNSSSGILEVASLGVPVINLGDRQKGRERNGNVMDVSWEEGRKGIEGAIVRAVTDRAFLADVAKRENLYGDGRAGERIVRVLEGMKWPVGIVKGFCD